MQSMAFIRSVNAVCFSLMLSLGGLSACSMSDLVNGSQLPADQRDPNAIKNPEGAMAAYNATLIALATSVGGRNFSDSGVSFSSGGIPSYVFLTGMLTDELQFYRDLGNSPLPISSEATLDNRTSPENDLSTEARQRLALQKSLFESLHTVRNRAREGIGALRKYAPNTSQALVGHLFAIEGMADVLLAEMYCSGIPLSTLVFEGSFTLTRGFTSEEVYQTAIRLFDSALVYSADSVRITNFARIGKARALLALGDYNGAKQSVLEVPTEYNYLLTYTSTRMNSFATSATLSISFNAHVGNSEGGNGLPFRFGDPRGGAIIKTEGRDTIYIPKKYFPPGPTTGTNPGTMPIALASGIEARLVEAEAAYQARDYPAMLTILNKLRTTCTTAVGCPTPAPMGDGGYDNLPPLQDPGSDTARVTLLFDERAYWLYLTGHRQGDLRRLVRQYDRRQEQVYPVGLWGPQLAVPYGVDVNIPVPVEERDRNSLYKGCANRDA